MPPDSRPDDLATALARMTQRTEQQTLDRIVAYAVDLVDGCDSAGVLAIEAGSPRTLAATDDVAVTSDQIQLELGEGPCMDGTLRDERVYRITDMATDTRWRRYASRAHERGIGSSMGFLLYTRERNLGALNLHGRNREAFGERSEHIGWLLASHAAVAFASARSDAQLQQAIASRQEIGEALGIMMERRKISEQEAFDLLRRRSQDRNVKLRDLARQLTETGELPDG
jgi:GAF domain-containing protein